MERRLQRVGTAYKNKQRNQREKQGKFIHGGSVEKSVRNNPIPILRDLRTYFNHILKTNYNFTSKEAGAYIGNNEVVNELHYSPYHEPTIRDKMQKLPLKEAHTNY